MFVYSHSFKFSFLDDDKPQIIVEYLTTKYNATAILDTLDTNPVFRLHIEPEYKERAKILYDQIIQTKINIEDMKRKGIKDSIITQAQAFLAKTEDEFDKIKSPYIIKSIRSAIYPLLSQAQDSYIAIIMDYINDKTDLEDLVNLIIIAIINV
jgi:hypothetical protein